MLGIAVDCFFMQNKNEPKIDEYDDDLIIRLVAEKKVATDFQERRHEQWNENYELYRNKVKTNRLTQRQAVNIPLMKETVKTLLSKIDDPPDMSFQDLDGDTEKEIVCQEMWESDIDRINFEGIDLQDKKTVLLYGRGTIKLNFIDGQFEADPLDAFDVPFDPLMNPMDIETARFIIHQNIFRSLKEVLADKRYSKEGKKTLESYILKGEGLIQSGEAKEQLDQQRERLEAMDVEKKDFDELPAGTVLLNLTEHYTLVWDKKTKKFIRYVVVYVNDKIRLMAKPLKEVIGVEFWPFVSWVEDFETQDIYPDAVADLVRVPNKILNIWFSQMTENRTLKNFNMSWYDATIEGFQPQTYEPGPGRMLPAPGDPNKTIKAVEVPGLEDTMPVINFLIGLVEKGSAVTALDKGVSEKKQITLGEVEILVGKAMERVTTIAKMYRRARKELAQKWYKIVESNVSNGGTTTLYKSSSKGKIWPKTVKPSDWKSKTGYRVKAVSSVEQEVEDTEALKRHMAVKAYFPDNVPLNRILQKKMLEILKLSVDELREIEEFEKKRESIPAPTPSPGEGGGGEEQKMGADIIQGLGELESLGAGA